MKMIAMKSTEVQNPRRDFYGSREGHRFELGVWSLALGVWRLAWQRYRAWCRQVTHARAIIIIIIIIIIHTNIGANIKK